MTHNTTVIKTVMRECAAVGSTQPEHSTARSHVSVTACLSTECSCQPGSCCCQRAAWEHNNTQSPTAGTSDSAGDVWAQLGLVHTWLLLLLLLR
jgi:hypothetical protein